MYCLGILVHANGLWRNGAGLHATEMGGRGRLKPDRFGKTTFEKKIKKCCGACTYLHPGRLGELQCVPMLCCVAATPGGRRRNYLSERAAGSRMDWVSKSAPLCRFYHHHKLNPIQVTDPNRTSLDPIHDRTECDYARTQ
ncbi:hypothetical protein GDO81_021890 [Engystomops pustulosus]|uniref:Uncharacterized protein n=1 Tax=Engystomops pustulosus TaxID=76066 RepID=A0AAV6YUI0_ENGPU|nr:hypothetical protein GDO81_021890 [Engystomops pustulosus]